MIKLLELFGGIGAPRKALVNMGVEYKAIDYVEICLQAVKSYNALFKHTYNPQSVIGYNLQPDLLIHGSPCQDFSRSGKRLGGKGEDKTRSSLMWETLEIIESLGVWRPKVVIWENVTGSMEYDNIETFNKYLRRMVLLGYTNSYKVLNAMNFGIPQKRNRVFVVSVLGEEEFNFATLVRKPLKHINDFLEQNVTESKYMITQPSMIRRISEFAPAHMNYRPLGVIDDHCWTISTRQDRSPNAGIVKSEHSLSGYRYLTERECWRLMGFNDEDFNKVLDIYPEKKGKRNATLYRLAGNSIVVDVLESIFKGLIDQGFIQEERNAA